MRNRRQTGQWLREKSICNLLEGEGDDTLTRMCILHRDTCRDRRYPRDERAVSLERPFRRETIRRYPGNLSRFTGGLGKKKKKKKEPGTAGALSGNIRANGWNERASIPREHSRASVDSSGSPVKIAANDIDFIQPRGMCIYIPRISGLIAGSDRGSLRQKYSRPPKRCD